MKSTPRPFDPEKRFNPKELLPKQSNIWGPSSQISKENTSSKEATKSVVFDFNEECFKDFKLQCQKKGQTSLKI